MRKTPKKDGCDILLIHPPYHRRSYSGIVPPIGLAYLASFVRKRGFSARILDCSLYFDTLETSMIEKMRKWLPEKVTSSEPRLAIGIGPCVTSTVRSMHAIADICQEICPDTPLIFGGPLAYTPGQDWLFFQQLNASALVKGDGEYPLSQILNQLRAGGSLSGIPGVQTAENQRVEPYLVEGLDRLPHPDWNMLRMNCYKPSARRDLFAYPFASVIGSRGCPYHCSFCTAHLIKYRRRSFGNIAREVGVLYKNYGVRSIIFYDDALFTNMSKINQELRLFAELLNESAPGILWQIEIRPDVFSAMSSDTFKYVFAHGCRQLNIGIEKFSSSQLRLLSKPYSTDQLKETCELANKVCPKMRLVGTFIFGGPGETLESINETIEFSTQLGLLFTHYHPLKLYPGTPLYSSVFGQDKRAWFDKIMNDKWPWGEIIYEDGKTSVARLVDWVHFAYHRFYGRHEWKELAKYHLGQNYKGIQAITQSWQEDRFRLRPRG